MSEIAISQGMKVVIALKGNRASIGVQALQCDPVFVTLEGSLREVLERLPGLVEEASRHWDSNPRYPKCEVPLPSQVTPPSRPAAAPQRQAAATSQPRMF